MDQLVYILIVKSRKCHAVYRRYFCKQQQPLFCYKSTSAQRKIRQVHFCNGKDHVKVFGGTGNGEIFKHRGRGLTAPCGRDRRKRTEEQDTALLLYPGTKGKCGGRTASGYQESGRYSEKGTDRKRNPDKKGIFCSRFNQDRKQGGTDPSCKEEPDTEHYRSQCHGLFSNRYLKVCAFLQYHRYRGGAGAAVTVSSDGLCGPTVYFQGLQRICGECRSYHDRHQLYRRQYLPFCKRCFFERCSHACEDRTGIYQHYDHT